MCIKAGELNPVKSFFLGLVNYYSKFMQNLASVLHPLYQLLQKDVKFKWTAETQKAFEKVKTLITAETVLTHYDADLPVRLACDSSAYGLGAVISHVMENGEERPIAFASRSLNSAEQKLCANSQGSFSYNLGSKEISLLSLRKKIHFGHGSLTSIDYFRSKERDTSNDGSTAATLRIIFART